MAAHWLVEFFGNVEYARFLEFLALAFVDLFYDAWSVKLFTLTQKLRVVKCFSGYLNLAEAPGHNVEHHSEQQHVHLDFNLKELFDEEVLAIGIGIQVKTSENHGY